MVFCAIMAGGQGARFWPVSRQRRPKQFLSISESGESLIQATARRVLPLVHETHLLVVTNALHEKLVREHLPSAEVICEPVGRNTAAPIGIAALWALKQDRDATLIVLPADHAVHDERLFQETLRDAVAVAEHGPLLVTIGIPPTSPHTGYGYIQFGEPLDRGSAGRRLVTFHEKPSLERATQYLSSGDFLWNSGMFVWKARTILDAIHTHMPKLGSVLESIAPHIGGEGESQAIAAGFDRLDSISIDVGVMEKASNCAVVPARSFGWNDVGAWDSWAQHFAKDGDGNVTRTGANPPVLIDSQRCVVYSEQRTVAIVGCSDLMVIDSPDGLLVCPRERAQEVRGVTDELKRRGRTDLL